MKYILELQQIHIRNTIKWRWKQNKCFLEIQQTYISKTTIYVCWKCTSNTYLRNVKYCWRGKYIFWQQEIHVGNNKIITVNTIKIKGIHGWTTKNSSTWDALQIHLLLGFELFSFNFQNLRGDKGKENYEREQRSSGLNERHLQRQRVNSWIQYPLWW